MNTVQNSTDDLLDATLQTGVGAKVGREGCCDTPIRCLASLTKLSMADSAIAFEETLPISDRGLGC